MRQYAHTFTFLSSWIGANMEEQAKIVSKILVCETDQVVCEQIKQICQENNLHALKVQPDTIINVLNSSIDLGGILLHEDADQEIDGIELGIKLHDIRPELPIFLRSKKLKQVDELPEKAQSSFAGVYCLDNQQHLKSLLDVYLFTTYYPDPLVRKILDISYEAFNVNFKNIEATCELPYLVKDKLIYGELFSLMALESDWCRGYMMIQTEQETIARMITGGKTALLADQENVNFRDINAVISEITNLIWGGIKNQFFVNPPDATLMRTQVPIIVNHGRKYISFGSENPQLCFRYILNDVDGKIEPLTLYQKFIFHLDWSPDRFPECQQAEDELVDSGELELF